MKQTDEEQAEEIRVHARLFDIHTQAVIATTTDGRIVYWSDAAARLCGWPADEVMGRNIIEVTPTDVTRNQAAEIMQQLRAGRGWSGEFRVRRRSGEEFRAHVRDVPVHDRSGAFVGIVGISTPL